MPTFVSLAEKLLSQAKLLDEALDQNEISHTSFDNDTLDSLPKDAQKLRLDLLDTSNVMTQLARGAKMAGMDMAIGWTQQVILRIIWRYKLASAVPVDGTATYEEISTASGLNPRLVARTIRAAISFNIFDESEPGRIKHSAISRLLATSDGFYDSVGLQMEDIGPASSKLIDAWQKFGSDAGDPTQSAFSLYHGGKSLFALLSEEPDRAHRFDSAMKYLVEDKTYNIYDIVSSFDWSKIDKPGARLIDLGGGYGQNCQVLAEHTQHLTFIVQDLPHVVEQGRQMLPSKFSDRISFEAQDFLQAQAVRQKPVDAYLISRCLHNWSDYHCARILRCLVPTLRAGSRVLIWDAVMDERPVRELSKRIMLLDDFIMAIIANGKNRTVEEFERVLKVADESFKLENNMRPTDCELSMVEVSWSPQVLE